MKAFVLLVSGLPMLAGMMLLISTFQQSVQAEQATAWRQTMGVVVEAPRHAGYMAASAYPRERLDTFFYRYEVAGVSYESNRIGFAAFNLGKEYRRGEAVSVYYDPQRPSEAAMQVGVGIAELLSYGVAFALLGIGEILRRRLAAGATA